jgi:hypothetical protein
MARGVLRRRHLTLLPAQEQEQAALTHSGRAISPRPGSTRGPALAGQRRAYKAQPAVHGGPPLKPGQHGQRQVASVAAFHNGRLTRAGARRGKR